jgi:hypothetical protein
VFRSPFQTSHSQQSLNEQKSSKLASLASLQLTPTLGETTKRKIINALQKPRELTAQSSQMFTRSSSSHHHPSCHPGHQSVASSATAGSGSLAAHQTTSSLLSLDTCGLMMTGSVGVINEDNRAVHGSSSSLDSTNSHTKTTVNNELSCYAGGEEPLHQPGPRVNKPLMQHLPDVTNILQSNSFKRQLS